MSSAMQPILEFQNVSKRYSWRTALHEVSFTLPLGCIAGVIGPNGSGKSTLLKLAAGLLRPSRGSISVAGRQVHRLSSSVVSYLSELDVYYPFFSVGETVQFYAEQYHDFDHNKALDMLQFMNLDPAVQVRNLSKGNRNRLKIVLALSRKVPLVLMDEPLAGIDPMARAAIIKSLIKYIDLTEQTIVLSTHEVDEVEPLLDWIIAIQDGRIYRIERTDAIREQYQLSLVEWMQQIFQ